MKKEKISECPLELKKIIYSVNLLPKDLSKFESDLAALGKQSNPKEISKFISSELTKSSKYTFERNDFLNVEFQLNRLINEKTTLIEIILAFQTWDIDYNRKSASFYTNLTKPLSAFGFNEDTSLELLSFRVLEVLTKNKIPIERIRICPICQNIFWAKRLESPACSDPHVNTFNARKTRIRKLEIEYNSELGKLEKQQSKLSLEHPLVTQQKQKIIKLAEKIRGRKRKYGSL